MAEVHAVVQFGVIFDAAKIPIDLEACFEANSIVAALASYWLDWHARNPDASPSVGESFLSPERQALSLLIRMHLDTSPVSWQRFTGQIE